MGGDHHEVKIPKVPDYTIYKVEDSRYLTRVQERLAKHGLKDPWLRNYVWHRTVLKSMKDPGMFHYMTHGKKYFIPLVVLTIAVESFLGLNGHSHDNHDTHATESH